MTTLAELIDAEPEATWGYPVNEITYGAGTWRFVFMVADQGAGSSVEWHDLTGPVSEVTWTRGSGQARGRFQAIEPSVLINALDDSYAPWNPDTSATFGTHVPLRSGRLLMRASLIRVVGGEVVTHFPLFTARVRRWADAQAANGGYRYHRVDGIDLMSYLVQAPVPFQNTEGWYARLDDHLDEAGWPFGATIHGARTADSTTTLLLAEQAAADSAMAAIDATLDPVGLTWRTTPKGELLVHPYPWDSFHAGFFASTTETIVGTEYTPRIESYYPGGPTFAYDAADGEVQFITEVEGGSFGINSDIENVANEWQITHPVVTTNLDSGYTTSAYDDAVSAGRYGRRAIPAASWLAENDTVLQDFVDEFAYTDLVAAPLTIDIRHPGVFPAIALLDHFDPCTIRHASKHGRTEITASGPMRSISHRIRKWGPNLLWQATVQVDIDAESTSMPLNPVQNLAVESPVPDVLADFTWTNPSQTVTPTGTQVRMIGVSNQWVDIPYGGTGAQTFDWLFLTPSTFYEFEVRLIREVSGTITHVSPTRSVAFFTGAAAEPIPSDDGETIVIPTDPTGECNEIDWKLESSDDGETWTLVDSGDESDFTTNSETGDTELDLSEVEWTTGLLYRVCTRFACGTPTEYVCSIPFQPDCAEPSQLSEAPFDDALLFIPQVCGSRIEDAVSDEPISLGPAFGGVGFDDDGEYVLTAFEAGVVCYGESENLPLADGDRSLHWRGVLGTVEEVDPLLRVGRLRLVVLDAGDSDFRFAAIKSFAGGSITAIGTTSIQADTEYDVYATWDRDTATVAIIVDGSEEDTAEDAASYVNTPNLPSFSAKLPAGSWCTELAVWSRVVIPADPDLGVVWTSRASAADNNWRSVCWSPELSLFVAVSASGSGDRVMTSPDGVNWTSRTSAADNSWRSVCWGAGAGMFVAVSDNGTTTGIMTSPDGITWTARATPSSTFGWRDVCWSEELGLFCAVRLSASSTQRAMTSPDGINWTLRTTPNQSYSCVTWSPDLELFVAAASAAGTNKVMTSPDGVNWTGAAGLSGGWISIAWSPELGLFCAVSLNANDLIMTSPDGVNWTMRSAPTEDFAYNGICWSPEAGLFVAVGDNGVGTDTDGRVITSPDGINWTNQTAASGNDWESVCWSPELSLFVAVSDEGSGDRVMTSP